MQITRAGKADVPGIMAVLADNLMSNKAHKDPVSLAQSGFLMRGYTEAELVDYLEDNKSMVFVAKVDNTVVGYAIEFPYSNKPLFVQDEQLNPKLQSILRKPEQVLYHRHIAKLPGYAGVGTKLLQAVIREAIAQNYRYILCQIIVEPYTNLPSIALHEKFDFKVMGRTSGKEGFVAKYYLKKL